MGTSGQRRAPATSKQRRPRDTDPYLISIQKAADLVGVSRNTFTKGWDETADGWYVGPRRNPILVPAYYVGTARRVPRLALEQALTTLAAT